MFCIVTPFSPSIGHTIDLASVTPFYLLPCPGPIYLLPVVPGPIYLLPVVATWIRETPLWERSELRRIYSLARSHSLLEYTRSLALIYSQFARSLLALLSFTQYLARSLALIYAALIIKFTRSLVYDQFTRSLPDLIIRSRSQLLSITINHWDWDIYRSLSLTFVPLLLLSDFCPSLSFVLSLSSLSLSTLHLSVSHLSLSRLSRLSR